MVLLFIWLTMPAMAYKLPFHSYPQIEINGSNTLSYNLFNTSGDQALFQNSYYSTSEGLTNTSSLWLSGELLQDLSLSASVNADKFNPSDIRWNLRYDGHDADVLVGEFMATLSGNSFVSFNRTLTGIQVDTTLPLPRSKLTVVTTALQSQVRTETRYGEGITGPYLLRSSSIVPNSDVVLVNGERQQYGLEKDYTIDYRNGILTFTRIITAVDTITISYEVEMGGMGGGQLYGTRAQCDIAKGVNLGVTHLRIDSRPTPESDATVTETLETENFRHEYQLKNRPLSSEAPVTVTLNDRDDIDPANYTVDYVRGLIIFQSWASIPTELDSLRVRYTYHVPGVSGSDRAVTGVDIGWEIANGFAVRLDVAQSDMPTAAAVGSDTAFGVGMDYTGNRFSAEARLRTVDSGFSSLESAGYRNIEDALEWGCQYLFSDTLDLTIRGEDYREPLNPYNQDDSSAITRRDRTNTIALHYGDKRWPGLTLQRTTRDTRRLDDSAIGEKSILDTLGITWKRDAFTATANLSHAARASSQLLADAATTTATLRQHDSTTNAASLFLTYQPGDRFFLKMDLNYGDLLTNIDGAESRSGNQRVAFTSTYQLTPTISLNVDINDAVTDATKNPNDVDVPWQRNSSMIIGTTWSPSTRFSTELSMARDKATGGGDIYEASSNASTTLSSNLTWRPLDITSISGYWTSQRMHFTKDGYNTTNNMVGLNAEVTPIARLTLGIGGQYIWGESPDPVRQFARAYGSEKQLFGLCKTFRDDATYMLHGTSQSTLTSTARYSISRDHEIHLSGELGWGDDDNKLTTTQGITLGWSYRLTENLWFTLDGSHRKGQQEAKDGTLLPTSYSANTLDSQLSVNF